MYGAMETCTRTQQFYFSSCNLIISANRPSSPLMTLMTLTMRGPADLGTPDSITYCMWAAVRSARLQYSSIKSVRKSENIKKNT